MTVQAPIDPPDEGMSEESEWECPSCGYLAYCTVWTEVVGRYHATIVTVCHACEYQHTDEDYSYGYDG